MLVAMKKPTTTTAAPAMTLIKITMLRNWFAGALTSASSISASNAQVVP